MDSFTLAAEHLGMKIFRLVLSFSLLVVKPKRCLYENTGKANNVIGLIHIGRRLLGHGKTLRLVQSFPQLVVEASGVFKI